ncbi:AlkA N-terminal domain-containing protein [Litorivivens sp.]|uniref:AlkA N-terminal domain-containing protein n=2 Tax=Litorivivens sp. TaxID=2020868 RepID=UPI003562F5EE
MENTLHPDQCYQQLAARDSRFDGAFYVGVTSTGVYCRPICRVRLPQPQRCRFFPSAAAAESSGFRPCLRCRPELAPGHSREDAVGKLAHTAANRIRRGALNDGSLETLASELGVSSRHIRRALEKEFGASPLAMAQTARLLSAKQLLTDSTLSITDIAFASGFSSVRRFNDAFRKHYRLTPSALRKQTGKTDNGALSFRLGYRPPLHWDSLAQFLHSRSAAGTSELSNGVLSKTLHLGNLRGWFSATIDDKKHCLVVNASPVLSPAFASLTMRLRHYFDLDANPDTIDSHLAQNPQLKPLIQQTPGLRLPGALDAFELAARAIIGQQVSVKAASTVFNRLCERFGKTLDTPVAGLSRLPPRAEVIAVAAEQELIALGLTSRRAATLKSLADALAQGELHFDYGDNSADVCRELESLPGIGPWTAQYIALRALGDPDAFPASDLALMKAFRVTTPKASQRAAETLRPWRAYAAIHLWNSLNAGG